MEFLRSLNVAQNNLNNAIHSFSKNINPVSAAFDYLGEQSIKGRMKDGGYATLDANEEANFEEDGRFKTTPLEWFLGKTDSDVKAAYTKELRKREQADAAKYGYSLDVGEGDQKRIKLPAELRRDKAFYQNDIVQDAILEGVDVDSTGTIGRVAKDLKTKKTQDEVIALGGDGSLTGPALARAKINAQRRAGREDAVYKAGTDLAVKAKSLGLGEGATAEDIRTAEGIQTYGKGYDSALGTYGNQEKAELGTLVKQNDINFDSKQSRYERYRNQETDRRSDYRFDLNRADKLAAQSAEIDLAKMKMEHQLDLVDRQHEMDMQHYQQGMLGNLLGGLFSLGSLL